MSKEFVIRSVRKDPKLIRLIIKNRPNIKREKVEEMLKYNILTSSQLGDLTGKRSDTIITMSRVQLIDGKPFSKLTRVIPFKRVEDDEKSKTMFILVDDKCKKFLIENNS